MKPINLALALLLFAPLAYAFDCSYFSGADRDDCLDLQSYNASLISNLIYQDSSFSNHEAIENYNNNIELTPTATYSSGNIRNAWLEVPYIYPSIIYNNNLLAETFQFRGDYDYSYSVPPDYYNPNQRDGDTCRIYYDLSGRSADLDISANGILLSHDMNSEFSIANQANFRLDVDYSVTIRERYYDWNRYCCRRRHGSCVRYCYTCDYDHTSYDTDTLRLTKDFSIYPYNEPTEPSYTFLYEYGSNYWGNLSSYDGNMKLSIADDFFNENKYAYHAEFIKPFDYIQLYAADHNFTSSRGLSYDNGLLISDSKDECSITYQDFFQNHETSCTEDIEPIPVEDFKEIEASKSWNLLYMIGIFLFVNIILYHVIRKYWMLF